MRTNDDVLYLGDLDESWKLRAACRGLSPEVRDAMFFAERGYNYDEARKLCMGTPDRRGRKGQPPCPVQKECLNYALSLPQRQVVGFWGGHSQTEREAILRDINVMLTPRHPYK